MRDDDGTPSALSALGTSTALRSFACFSEAREAQSHWGTKAISQEHLDFSTAQSQGLNTDHAHRHCIAKVE